MFIKNSFFFNDIRLWEESVHAYPTAELMVSTVMSLSFSTLYKIKLVHTVHSFKDLITQMGLSNTNQQIINQPEAF